MSERKDLIVVRGISFLAHHGATEEEQRSSRRFEVDVELAAVLRHAGETDDLVDTIDYRGVCELVVEIGTARTYRLIETVAAAILKGLAERYSEADITVEVRKVAPPIAGTPVYSSVKLQRVRG